MTPLSQRQLEHQARLDREARHGYPSYVFTSEEQLHYAHGPVVDEFHAVQTYRSAGRINGAAKKARATTEGELLCIGKVTF